MYFDKSKGQNIFWYTNKWTALIFLLLLLERKFTPSNSKLQKLKLNVTKFTDHNHKLWNFYISSLLL